MRNKDARIGAEYPELSSMNWRRLLTIGAVAVAALGSAVWILLQRNAAMPMISPTDAASDYFNRWEQPADWPLGLAVADSARCVLTAFVHTEDSTLVLHSTTEPTALPDGWVSRAWNGGWLLGPSLEKWEQRPGTMAAHWQPRTGGRNVLTMHPNGTVESSFQRNSSGRDQRLWVTQSFEGGDATVEVLPGPWAVWFDRIAALRPEVDAVAVGAHPTPELGVDSLAWLVGSAWLECEVNGRVLRAFGGVDSLAAVQHGGSWSSGIWYVPARDVAAWASLPDFPQGVPETAAPFDFARRDRNEIRTGQSIADGRVVWNVEFRSDSDSQPRTEVLVSQPGLARPADVNTSLLGTARNHRSGNRMDVVLEEGKVVAKDAGKTVWEVAVATETRPEVWEVDLYRNGKYQVAIGVGKRFHLIDVLGREVAGFPKRWSDGFSAFAVFDYDKNRQYRFLLAAPNGQVFNFRKEGERTPGWKFQPRSGRHIVSLAHVRIGPKDYIFAGQDNGTVRILGRTGEDRYDSPLRVPTDQKLAFRIGKDLPSSTVLFVDEEGWVQERTVAANEAVGMSRLTRGTSVRVEDQTGDGIPEVVVTTPEGEEIWDARNQRLGT